MQDASQDGLEDLLRTRYHGASNVKGIRYQLKYSLVRCLELAIGTVQGRGSARKVVRFEGIEDVDVLAGPALLPLRASDPDRQGEEFVQAKTATKAWSWHKLSEPLARWIEILGSCGTTAVMRLVVDFPLQGDLGVLSRYADLDGPQRELIRRKFAALCQKVGGTPQHADRLLASIQIESLPEHELDARNRTRLAELTEVSEIGSLCAYELMLAGKCLDWAASRGTVSGDEVVDLIRCTRDALARDRYYQAVARHWVGPLRYAADDGQPDDFYAGKRTRVGHIVANLDVVRNEWLGRIDKALLTRRLCVIRGPSGNGKSALALRYAVTHWAESEVVVVRSAGTPEEVGASQDYLRYRADLGLPVRVLIDADSGTRLWARVAAHAVALGAQVLVTVRAEDWHRFAEESLAAAEVLEPALELDEARRIFETFREQKRVHPSVDSAEWAYEKLRSPRLMLEYVFLLTHGVMLEDRLRDQIREMHHSEEDPKKIEVLRLVGLANALGASVQVERLLSAVQLRDDPQMVIGSLVGEYVTLSDGRLDALHWVRSEHIARILHTGGGPTATASALTVMRLIPESQMPFLVANAMRWEGIDRSAFLNGLVSFYRNPRPAGLLPVIEALFEVGETDFFQANRVRFDDAFAVVGAAGVSIVSAAAAPVGPYDLAGAIIRVLGDRSGAFPRLKEIADRIQPTPRGMDMVCRFLQPVVAAGAIDSPLVELGALGQLLDWCALSGVSASSLDAAVEQAMSAEAIRSSASEDLASFSQGLFRYDRRLHHTWCERHREELLPRFQEQADSLVLRLIEHVGSYAKGVGDGSLAEHDGAAMPSAADRSQRECNDADRAKQDAVESGTPTADVAIVFPVESAGSETPNEQAMRRLRFLRRALPSCGRFCSRGDYFLPTGFPLQVDDTVKSIPRWNLPFPSDVQKNGIWLTTCERAYYADTLFRLQRAWFTTRSLALKLVAGLMAILKRALSGRPAHGHRELGEDESVVKDFVQEARRLPRLAARSLAAVAPGLPSGLGRLGAAPDKWIAHLESFRDQFWRHTSDPVTGLGRLAVVNLRESVDALPDMHAFFDKLFQDSPDYFGARRLDGDEIQKYGDLLLLVEASAIQGVGRLGPDPLGELRGRASTRHRATVDRLVCALSSLRGLIRPNGLSRHGSVLATVFGVEVADLFPPYPEVLQAIAALRGVEESVYLVWLVPVMDGSRLGPDGYRAWTRHPAGAENGARADDDAAFHGLVPLPLPAEMEPLLPPIPVVAPPDPTIGARLSGLRTLVLMVAKRRVMIREVTSGNSHPSLVELHRRHRSALTSVESEGAGSATALQQEIREVTLSRGAAGPVGEKLLEYVRCMEAFLRDPDATAEAIGTWDEATVDAAWSAFCAGAEQDNGADCAARRRTT